MKRIFSLLMVAALCFGIVGCGEAADEESAVVLPEETKNELQNEENTEDARDEILQVEDKTEEYVNDYFKITYDSNSFTLDDKGESVALYTKIDDKGGNNTLFGVIIQENPEFDFVSKSEIETVNQMVSMTVCQEMYSIDKGVEIINETYDTQSGYCMELSDGSKCYARIMSYGKQMTLATCRLCTYSETVNDKLYETYLSAQSLVKEEFPEEEVPEEIKEKSDGEQNVVASEEELNNNEEDIKTDVESVTMGQKNALSKAKQYLELMAFSHSGLIEQLEYEGFLNDEAVYAADNCGADWNEQAVKKAKSYLDLMSFSKAGLIEQLVYDGFSQEQATYGAESNGY